MSKKKIGVAIIAIHMVTILAGTAVSPALANISQAFPDVPYTTIKMIMTFPYLFIALFSILCGKLMTILGKRNVLTIGSIFFTIGGVGCAFVNTLSAVFVFRAICGIGCGLMMPIAQALIGDYYDTPDERSRMAGFGSASNYFTGFLMSILIAFLSSINWHYGFYIYLVTLLALILFLKLLPQDKPTKAAPMKQAPFKKIVWLVFLGIFGVNISLYAVQANIALIVQKEGIGDSGTTGIVLAVFMLSGVISGLSLSLVKKAFGRFYLPVCVLVMGSGYLILTVAPNALSLIIGTMLVAIGFGIIYPSLAAMINIIGGSGSNSYAVSLGLSSMYLGQFLSPIVLQFFCNVFHQSTNLRFNFTFLTACFAVVAVGAFAFQILRRPSPAMIPEKS